MPYRAPGKSPDTTPRLRFRQRWFSTITAGGGYFGVGMLFMLLAGGPTLVWTLAGFILVGVAAVIDTRVAPGRLREQERIRYITNLPRTPDGGAIVNRAEWEQHFPRNES